MPVALAVALAVAGISIGAEGAVLRAGSDHDQRESVHSRVLPDGGTEFFSIHLRHQMIQQRDLEGPAFHLRRPQSGHRLDTVGDRFVFRAPVFQLALQDAPIDLHVVHDQNSRRLPWGIALVRWSIGRRLGARQGEPEGRSGSGRALDADLPSHQPHQLFADRQPQSRAAELARRGRIGLAELVEQRRLFVLWNSDARVRHRHAHSSLIGLMRERRDARHGHQHMAGAGEFEGVADEVEQHLADAAGVADQLAWRVRGVVEGERQMFLGGAAGEQFQALRRA